MKDNANIPLIRFKTDLINIINILGNIARDTDKTSSLISIVHQNITVAAFDTKQRNDDNWDEITNEYGVSENISLPIKSKTGLYEEWVRRINDEIKYPSFTFEVTKFCDFVNGTFSFHVGKLCEFIKSDALQENQRESALKAIHSVLTLEYDPVTFENMQEMINKSDALQENQRELVLKAIHSVLTLEYDTVTLENMQEMINKSNHRYNGEFKQFLELLQKQCFEENHPLKMYKGVNAIDINRKLEITGAIKKLLPEMPNNTDPLENSELLISTIKDKYGDEPKSFKTFLMQLKKECPEGNPLKEYNGLSISRKEEVNKGEAAARQSQLDKINNGEAMNCYHNQVVKELRTVKVLALQEIQKEIGMQGSIKYTDKNKAWDEACDLLLGSTQYNHLGQQKNPIIQQRPSSVPVIQLPPSANKGDKTLPLLEINHGGEPIQQSKRKLPSTTTEEEGSLENPNKRSFSEKEREKRLPENKTQQRNFF